MFPRAITLLRRCAPVAACLLFLAASSHGADAVELKPQWIIGKRYTQQMQMDQASTIAFAGQTMEQKVTMNMDTVLTVTKHEDPTLKRVQVKYDRMAMSMDMNGQKMGYDSTKPNEGNDPLGMGKTFSAIVGKEFSVILGADGKVKDVENIDSLLNSLDSAVMMKGMFSKDSFAQMIEQSMLHNFPQKPVSEVQLIFGPVVV